jgi:glycosyltransferase involved in cell wall biosynthesis
MSMSSCTVEILLPTYNGCRFINDQMQSLCRQTCRDFTLLTYDDGSSDDSMARVDAYRDRISIKRIENQSGKNSGAIKSFEILMSNATAECIMFCDQDDIWESAKVERGVHCYLDGKKCYGDIPLCLFSDLRLIDENNRAEGASFMALHGMNPACLGDPYYLVFRNPAPGCSMIANRKLIASALPIGKEAFMHDWWTIIGASLEGRIIFIDEQLVSYRVHSANTFGMTPDRPLPALLSAISMFNVKKLQAVVGRMNVHIRQGRAVFKKNNHRFSVALYWAKLVFGRYVMPSVASVFKAGKQYSWKRIGS